MKGNSNEFGKLWPHEAVRLLKRDGGWRVVDADFEQGLYEKWGKSFEFEVINNIQNYFGLLKENNVVKKSPIPGSSVRKRSWLIDFINKF
jgi:hypothetical protein